ncbi:hypothetical protein [Timonella senegalensis]|uniref:hypothetical protein n=1 Tax=Timonella senegalensis TaxID=1465825 RepID=UPI0028AD854F|nr:hypothetical protein [Timonella senegalensis]
MSEDQTRAQRFLSAFSAIEDILSTQQYLRNTTEDWTPFSTLVHNSETLLHSHKEQLKRLAKLRNAIAHGDYRNGEPIADPREETVEQIAHIHNLLAKPPLLIDALAQSNKPRIFQPTDPISEFLSLVTQFNFSQVPVKVTKGYDLLTTNAVARWFAANYEAQTIDASVSDVLAYAESGDRLQTVNPSTTTVDAIRLFSGLADTSSEPPAALLVRGTMGTPPQKLCVRSDLTLLYAQLEGAN